MTNPIGLIKLAYSIPEAAAAISIGRSKIYTLIAEGRIETRKIGKRTIIPAASLEKLLKS
jgi:excisionase family DNA binding protein